MEPKIEKKSIKNEVEKKMQKKCGPRALSRLIWRNAGAGWGTLGGGKDLSEPGPGQEN